jgi:serine/threonine-protein kinase
MACSFGEIDSDPVFDNIEAPAPPAQGDEGPGTVDPANPTTTVNTPSQPNTPAAPVEYDPNDPFSSEMGKQVKSILEVNCGGCHSNGVSLGDMNYILDLKELIKQGKVIPGDASDSQIFIRMQQQSMPPAFIRDQRPTFGQIELVGQFFDSLEPVEAYACEPYEFMTQDEMITAMSDDVARVDAADQPFTRYLTVTYNTNAGGCGRELDRQRYALYKGINSVSTNTRVTQPVAIDENETIFRIDIRDYNWDRAIDIEDDGIVDFDDAWLAIVDASAPYALEFEGDQADDLKQDTQTAVPFMPVNAFIQSTEQGDLYYSLIGALQNLFDFEREVLLIDTALEIADDNLMRAGFSNSGVSKQERVLNRFDNGLAAGQSYWISFDFDGGNGNGEVNGVSNGFETNVANESIYDDPLDFAFAGGEAIFSLPNGMQGYYVAAANGLRLAEAPVGVVIDPAQNNGLVTNGASCHSCHQAGLITFTDTVRDYVIQNSADFDNDTFESVMEQYPEPLVFQNRMDQDSAMHVRAVEATGIPPKTPDAITRVYLDFQLGDITARYAAGELNVTEEYLLKNINLLDPRLAPLARGTAVSRDIFDATYFDAICVLQGVSENAPANCP